MFPIDIPRKIDGLLSARAPPPPRRLCPGVMMSFGRESVTFLLLPIFCFGFSFFFSSAVGSASVFEMWCVLPPTHAHKLIRKTSPQLNGFIVFFCPERERGSKRERERGRESGERAGGWRSEKRRRLNTEFKVDRELRDRERREREDETETSRDAQRERDR